MHVLIVYHSRSGNTEKMAREVARGVESAGLEAKLKPVAEASIDDLLVADGIILGSPTYYGSMAGEMKSFLDSSARHHRKLSGKAGGAFTSSALIGGGNETTLLSMITALLIHGMAVQGTSTADHYGPVAIGAPDDKVLAGCRELGVRVANLARALASVRP
jgi:NAD(P)H dehydrogenase (quinone)